MTGKELLTNLQRLTSEELQLPAFAIHGASGASYSLQTYGDVGERRPTDDAGPLCELPTGTRYIGFYLDH